MIPHPICPYTISGCNYPQGECLGVCCAESRGHSATTETQARAGDPEVPKWWNCDTHGRGNHTAWGCPECVREMREAIAKKDAALDSAEQLCEWIMETPHQRGSINGKAARVLHSVSEAKKALK